MSRRFNSQIEEKDMNVMELRNALRRGELEGKRREQELQEMQRELENRDRVLGALNAQNTGLSSALELLKTQSAQITAANQSMMGECASLRKQLAQKTLDIKKL